MTRLVLLLGVVLPALGQSVPSDAAKLSLSELAQYMKVVCPEHLNVQTGQPVKGRR